MVQNALQRNAQRKRRNGENTPEGRRNQIASKITHGIRAVSPTLLGVELEEDWQAHYEGIKSSLKPGDPYEAVLIHKIAWQLWRLDRVIRSETALTLQKILSPPESMFDVDRKPTVTKELILDAIAQLGRESRNGGPHNGNPSKNSLLSRCGALARGAAEVMFDPSEAREILTLVLAQVRAAKAEEEINQEVGEIDGDLECSSEEGKDDLDEELTIEERLWSAEEIAGQLRLLCAAAGVDWGEELASAIQALEEAQQELGAQQEEARRHVMRNLILGERTVTRISLYERQIMSQLKATYTLLERARAWRLGMPVPPPVSLDVNITKTHDATGV
jgi:hypothetical protein